MAKKKPGVQNAAKPPKQVMNQSDNITRRQLRNADRADRRRTQVKKKGADTIKTLGGELAATSMANTQQREETKRFQAQLNAARQATATNLNEWNSIIGSNPNPSSGEAGVNGNSSTGDYGLTPDNRS